MKQAKNALLLVSTLAMLGIWGFIAVYRAGFVPTGLEIFIFLLIMVAAIYAFFTHLKQYKDVQSGFPAEDELSTRIKYKAGYYAFMASLYMWLFIFLFKGVFPDVHLFNERSVDTVLGGGILLMAVLSIAIKTYLTSHYHEDQN
jgi:hypothetical protein